MTRDRKSRHRVPELSIVSDPIDERYQAEVEASTNRLERQYRKAQRALQRAEEKAQRLAEQLLTRNTKRLRQQRDSLLLLVEQRRAELREIERLMIPTDYGGRDAHRRHVRHESGNITIPLGATTGIRPPQRHAPTFPVHTRTTKVEGKR